MADTDDERVANLFRKLRAAWFACHLFSRSPEREWQSEEADKQREQQNLRARKIYDEQTEALIRGEDLCVVPYCLNDMLRGKSGE